MRQSRAEPLTRHAISIRSRKTATDNFIDHPMKKNRLEPEWLNQSLQSFL